MKMPSPRLRAALRWLLAAVLLAFSLRLLAASPEPLRQLLAVRWYELGAIAALIVVNQVLLSFRFALAVEHSAKAHVPATVWVRLTVVGQFLNLFVPQLGNVYRGVALKREHGISYLTYASGLFAFVWLDLLMGLALALLAITVLEPRTRFAGLLASLWLGGTLAFVAVAPFAAARAVAMFHFPQGTASRVQARVAALLAISRSVLQAPTLLLRFGAVNLVATVGQVLALWLTFAAVGASAGLATMILFQTFVKLSNQVVITPGNLGLMELAYGVLAKASECTPEQGIAVALVLRGVWTVVSVALGLLFGGGALLGSRRREIEHPTKPGEA